MRDLVKILIAVGVGIAIALTVALSVTLTREKPSNDETSDDLGAQRFPDYNFVTFNDLWNGQLRMVDHI